MDYESLILNLIKIDVEQPWVEFKSNKNDPKMIGEDISALSNSALIHDKAEAFLVWGIRDDDHELIGTTFDYHREKVGNEDLVNWLRHNLSGNFEFFFKDVGIDGKRFVVLTITPPNYTPARFNKVAYIRDENHTKPLSKIPHLERKLWDRLNSYDYESAILKSDLNVREVANLLDIESIVSNLQLQMPTDDRRLTEILIDNGLAIQQPDGHLGITVLGAILFARNLRDFKELGTKTVRIVQYSGPDKTRIVRQHECEKGYATQFSRIIETISMLIPASQDILPDGKMVQSYAYPLEAIREVVANAIIHQDLSDPMHVIIEILDGRLTVTNSGTMLISPDRILDSPPLSRNKLLPEMFRRMGLCEQLGSGWDRIVSLCENDNLPTPRAQVFESSTVVTMFEKIPFEDMSPADRLWACYMHTCRMHMQGLVMTNQTLRTRFGLKDKNATVAVSRLIRTARDKGLIKNSDIGNGPKNQGYIPYWA